MIIMLTFCLALEGGVVKFGNTEMYQPFRANDVTVAEDGAVFASIFEERQIIRYSPDGTEQKVFGGKGEGPGEFNFINLLAVEDGKLYVFDIGNDSITIFDATTCEYIEKIKLAERGIQAMKVKGGWLYGNWMYSMDPNAPIELKLADNRMENPVTITSWKRDPEGSGMMVRSSGGVPKIPFNPAREQYQMAASGDRSTVFISHPGVFKISVLDVASKKIIDTLEPEAQAIPFSEEWGDKQLAALKEKNEGRGFQMEFVPDYPENFPIVRNLYVGPDNTLLIRRYSALEGERAPYLTLDAKGNKATLPYKPQNHPRVLAVSGGMAYVGAYDAEDDEASLLRVPIADIDAAIADHPIAFEGEAPRLLMRMN